MDEEVAGSVYCGILISIPGVVAWVTGQPFVFPSLGPSAFMLSFRRDRTNSARQVVGGHIIGVVAGWIAYTVFALGLTLGNVDGFASLSGLRLSASGVSSVTLTAAGMAKTETVHPPACASTLIVSLGILTSIDELLIIIVSVVLVFVVHAVLSYFSVWKQA
ncbi:HPP family protein [Halorutilales archaeon Cl-col2-1]